MAEIAMTRSKGCNQVGDKYGRDNAAFTALAQVLRKSNGACRLHVCEYVWQANTLGTPFDTYFPPYKF